MTRLLFIFTVFSSAFLLFLIQPMFARMALPLLGGAPSVWNTAMVFYQAVLLAGYIYAHLLGRFTIRTQVLVHLGVLLLAVAALPIGVAASYPDPDPTQPFVWLLGLLAVSIGLPFFAVSAQAPLMQRWFSRTTDSHAHDPYFLYAASNLGSMIALIAYPFAFEPLFDLNMQGWIWAGGYALLIGLIGLCGWTLLREAVHAAESHDAHLGPAPALMQRAHWVLLAAVPSGLLLSVTNYITADIMAMPLLWIIPLILYLLTFVIAFARRPIIPHNWAVWLTPFMLVAVGGLAFKTAHGVPIAMMGGILALMFLLCLVFHGELVARRPGVAHLTEFYILMSLGGVLGGAFVALVAPITFNWIYEYPILLVLAAVLLPSPKPVPQPRRWLEARVPAAWLDMTVPLLALTLTGFFIIQQGVELTTDFTPKLAALAALFIVLVLFAIGRPLRMLGVLVAAGLAFGGWLHVAHKDSQLALMRSFFGVYTVTADNMNQLHRLAHGTTLHGAQSRKAALARRPMTYYAAGSGVGQMFSAVGLEKGAAARFGVVGLGTGSLACYAQPGQDWTFYEIDPLMEQVAKDRRLFTYVPDCAPNARIVIGDARLSLKAEPEGRFDALAVDAFSSDSIPLHLITAEAVALYKRAVGDDGVVLLHISNRFLDLEPVIAEAAKANGLSARLYDYDPGNQPANIYYTNSTWIALTANPARLDELLKRPGVSGGWRALEPRPNFRLWTDQYANLLSVLNRAFER
jgi:spermidine synthase